MLANQKTFRRVAGTWPFASIDAIAFFSVQTLTKKRRFYSLANRADMSRTRQGFLTIRTKQFPAAFEAVDGCHIDIKINVRRLIREVTATGKVYTQFYYKEYAAQTVDFVGRPGAAHDARVSLNSRIFRKVSTSSDLLMLDETGLTFSVRIH